MNFIKWNLRASFPVNYDVGPTLTQHRANAGLVCSGDYIFFCWTNFIDHVFQTDHVVHRCWLGRHHSTIKISIIHFLCPQVLRQCDVWFCPPDGWLHGGRAAHVVLHGRYLNKASVAAVLLLLLLLAHRQIHQVRFYLHSDFFFHENIVTI